MRISNRFSYDTWHKDWGAVSCVERRADHRPGLEQVRAEGPPPPAGYIGSQDEAKPVWYRNVRIKELTDEKQPK